MIEMRHSRSGLSGGDGLRAIVSNPYRCVDPGR
jgi:hypothetical protein